MNLSNLEFILKTTFTSYFYKKRFTFCDKLPQFTYEIKNNDLLNFKNICVIKNKDNSISTNWFRKKSFSGRFLNYFPLHPLHQKIGIIKNLVDSAILDNDKNSIKTI